MPRARDESPPRDVCLAALRRGGALAFFVSARLVLGQQPSPTPPAPPPAPAPAPAPAVPAPAPAAPEPPRAAPASPGVPQSVAIDSGGFTAASSAIPAIPDPVKLAPAALSFLNPLFRAAETPARALDHPNPEDLETRAALLVAVHLLENGKPTETVLVEPPLAAFVPTVAAVAPKWTFTPAKKGGAPVQTWATYGIDLEVSLEKGVFSSFTLLPVGKDDPLPELVPESAGESWITRYPKEPAPPDGSVSIEDVDVLPSPEKTRWSFSSVKTSSRVTALVEVGANGVVTRIAPIGKTAEPLVIAWLRRSAGRWHVAPALSNGKPVASWMTLDATLEYTVDSAKEKGKRSLKKNLRGVPAEP